MCHSWRRRMKASKTAGAVMSLISATSTPKASQAPQNSGCHPVEKARGHYRGRRRARRRSRAVARRMGPGADRPRPRPPSSRRRAGRGRQRRSRWRGRREEERVQWRGLPLDGLGTFGRRVGVLHESPADVRVEEVEDRGGRIEAVSGAAVIKELRPDDALHEVAGEAVGRLEAEGGEDAVAVGHGD